jgi:hypothetical protein
LNEKVIIVDCRFSIADFPLPIADCRLPIDELRIDELRIHELPAEDCLRFDDWLRADSLGWRSPEARISNPR